MSEVRLVIRDGQRDISGCAHGGVAEAVVAALSAEPETIEELELAMERFVAPPKGGHFELFDAGVDDQPHDAGGVIVDLAARLVAHKQTYCEFPREGWMFYHDGERLTDIEVGCFLSEDWEITENVDGWQGLAERRRTARAANPPLDARAVLYGRPMAEFIARECLSAFAGRPTPTEGDDREIWQKCEDELRRIHAGWMLTRREDLGGAAPRDVMVAKRKQIGLDMQGRAEQWSQMLRPPRTLEETSAAYRFGGFGTHELVTYYELFRKLLWYCRKIVGDMPPGDAVLTDEAVAMQAAQMVDLREECLDEPDPEFHGRTPRSIIHNERIRLPEACSGKEMVVDDDCPLCQMQAEDSSPGFWFLDGCNMDDHFAFSFHRTREEYDKEQAEHREWEKRWEAEQAERERLGIKPPGGGYMDPDNGWNMTFSRDAPPESMFIRLFSVGSRLCEITAALKQSEEESPEAGVFGDPPPEVSAKAKVRGARAQAPSKSSTLKGSSTKAPLSARSLLDRLNRDYGNLRDVVHGRSAESAEALIQPVLDRLAEALDAVAATRAELRDKCVELQERLSDFASPPDGREPPREPDIPF